MPRSASPYAELFTAALNYKFKKTASSQQNSWYATFTIDPGAKYDRIVQSRYQEDSEGNQINISGSVHAFVLRTTGELLKPATWSAPAKHYNGTLMVKYDLSHAEDFDAALRAADLSGAYLYS